MSLLTDNLFLEHISVFMDILKYQINNPDDKMLQKNINFGQEGIDEITELILHIEDLSHTEYLAIVNEIKNYLKNVSFGQFMIDYIKCKCGLIINLDKIYKYNKKNKNMVNYKKNIIKNINFNNYILSDNQLYVLSNDKKSIEPSIDDINEFSIDFLNEKLTVYNKGDKNAFWTIYYLYEKHSRNELLFSVKQKIYDIKMLYDDIISNHNSTISNLVDVLGKINMNNFSHSSL